MSALAPTTSNRTIPILPDLRDTVIGYLSPRTQSNILKVSERARNEMGAYFAKEARKRRKIMDAYKVSQEAGIASDSDEYVSVNAKALVRKTWRLMGGAAYIARITKEDVSVFHPVSQEKLAAARWNCKVIGLLPFLQKIPAAAGCLQDVATLQTSEQKFQKMIEWIEANPVETAQLREVEIVDCKKEQVRNWVEPSFFRIPGKIYNLVPKEIFLFKGLQKLSLHNNLLTELPPQIAELPLQELDLGRNFFKQMPPPIRSLHKLSLLGNESLFPFENVRRFILEYIKLGGEDLEIHLEPEHFEDERYQNLMKEIGLGNTHTLKIENNLLILSKNPWRTEMRKGIPLFPIDDYTNHNK